MAELKHTCLRLCQTVDWLLEQSRLWQTEALEFLNDFSLLLYAAAYGGTADLLVFDRFFREPKRQEVTEGILSRYPSLKELDYEFGRGLKRISDEAWRELAECFHAFSPEGQLQKYGGKLFDYVLQSMYRKERISNFITPQSLAHMMADMLEPRQGELVIDPVCGCGRLLTAAAARCGGGRYIGNDLDGRIRTTAFFNTALHGMKDVELYQEDFLRGTWERQGDLILANPPYSDDVHATIRFLKKIMGTLKMGGRCGVLVPEGFLTNAVNAHVIAMRQILLCQYSLEAVISLPRKIYRPYTFSKSSLILVKKEKASPGHLTFFGSVAEYEGPENQFSDQVYGREMKRIAEAWKGWRRGECGSDTVRGNTGFWVASLEEIREKGYVFGADYYQKSKYKYTKPQRDKVWDNIFAGQKELERFVSDYFREDSAI
ncbi:MAG: N-6 DNA methylase [Lachnospiraceae bacterium]|nr:N-6 DNA methylase [Lachnospiraceae bacterium]